MTLADSLKPLLYSARAIAGTLGLRTHTISRVVRYADSPRNDVSEKETPITEANGQPPKIRWLTAEELTVGQLNPGTAEVGPMTPAFSGGGIDPELLDGDDLSPNDKMYFRIAGPHHPNGALYRRARKTDDFALHFSMQLVPVEQEGET